MTLSNDLLVVFDNLQISHDTIEHPEVLTVDAMMQYLNDIPGIPGKNLFLKDKKKQLYLLVTVHDRDVQLNDVAKTVSAKGGLRFADESTLRGTLNVGQGCVTPYALMNDTDNKVKLLVDADLLLRKHNAIYFHPLRNDASTGISPANFVKFVEHTGHPITVVSFQ